MDKVTKKGAEYKLVRDNDGGECWVIKKGRREYRYNKSTLQYYLIAGYPKEVIDFVLHKFPHPIPKKSIENGKEKK